MTKAVILAAGEGTRLRPLTDRLPKALVPLGGVPLLERQIAILRRAGIHDISIVTGHCGSALEGHGVRTFHNARYDATNMVASLRCAASLFDGSDDVLVAYGDIVYEPRVLQAVLDEPGPLAVAVDAGWQRLWSLRMEDPLSDAETMKLDAAGHILELGRKPRSLEDIQGQYIGLFKVSRSLAPRFLQAYDGLDDGTVFDSRPKEKMYMTSYLQHLIDAGLPVRAAPIDSGWLEVDTLQDLQRYESALADGTLAGLYDGNA